MNSYFDAGLGGLDRLSNAVTRSISPENKTGEKGMGGLSEPGERSPARNLGVGWKVRPLEVIAPNQTLTIAEIEGPARIQSIWMGGFVGWQIILRIYWDDQPYPSVEAPLGAFFGYGFQTHRMEDHTHIPAEQNPDGRFPTLNSLPVLVAPNRGLNCFWPMPFRKSCRITLENIGWKPAVTHYQINFERCEIPEDAAYFCATYRQKRPNTPGVEYVALDGVKGRGHYVGMALFVQPNGDEGCWVEGEVKAFLDDDAPGYTYLASGIEDYFGGSYGFLAGDDFQTYSSPFMGMYAALGPGRGFGTTHRYMLYRWHVMDPIRFETNIRVNVQDLGWRGDQREFLWRRDDFSSVAYWYQTLPTAPLTPLPGVNDLEIQ